MWREGAALLGITAIFGSWSMACEAPPEAGALELSEPRAATHAAIIGGSASTAEHDAVVLLNDNGREEGCSGTLIAPNLLLTARHCVTTYNRNDECGYPLGGDAPATLFTISVGQYAASSQTAARGVRLFTAQGMDGICGADIALILLDKDVPNGGKIAKLRFTAPSMGETSTSIGFGGGSGRRQRSVNILARGPVETTFATRSGGNIPLWLPPYDVATGESTCFGDSGGPLLDGSGAVIAVASRGIDDRCDDRPTIYTAIAPYETIVRDALKVAGHPLDGVATNPPPTPIPNGTLDNPDRRNGNDEEETDDEKKTSKKPKNQNVASMGCSLIASTTGSFSAEVLTACAAALTIALRRLSRRARSDTSTLRRR